MPCFCLCFCPGLALALARLGWQVRRKERAYFLERFNASVSGNSTRFMAYGFLSRIVNWISSFVFLLLTFLPVPFLSPTYSKINAKRVEVEREREREVLEMLYPSCLITYVCIYLSIHGPPL